MQYLLFNKQANKDRLLAIPCSLRSELVVAVCLALLDDFWCAELLHAVVEVAASCLLEGLQVGLQLGDLSLELALKTHVGGVGGVDLNAWAEVAGGALDHLVSVAFLEHGSLVEPCGMHLVKNAGQLRHPLGLELDLGLGVDGVSALLAWLANRGQFWLGGDEVIEDSARDLDSKRVAQLLSLEGLVELSPRVLTEDTAKALDEGNITPLGNRNGGGCGGSGGGRGDLWLTSNDLGAGVNDLPVTSGPVTLGRGGLR